MKTIEDLLREVSGIVAPAAEILRFASEWPPDIFALTSTLLLESGAYRRVVSPPRGTTWPREKPEAWDKFIDDQSARWIDWCTQRRAPGATAGASPVTARCQRIASNAAVPVAELGTAGCWDLLTEILTLQAIADSACADFGLGAPDLPVGYIVEAAKLLVGRSSTVSRFPTERVRVLPKTRTAQVGITVRSLSHHLALCTSEVDVQWVRTTYPAEIDRLMRLRVMLFPWPFEIAPAAFSPCETPLTNMRKDRFGTFSFDPKYDTAELAQRFASTLSTAKMQLDTIDAVMLPESAVTASEFDQLWDTCTRHGVHVLLSGVRVPNKNQAWLRTGIQSPQTYSQDKHHRWCLDAPQITTYRLGERLHPSRRWWESMDVERRSLTLVAFNDWLTVCHLICEDLARIDPVSQLVRAVGPTLVVALLLDGPQIPARWPGRYATVLADDPGSSVLTLTALGLSLRSRTKEHPEPNATIALWKDSRPVDVPIQLAPTSDAVVLTLWADRLEEFAADGRTDGGMSGRLILGDCTQIPGRGWSDPLTIGGANL